MGRDMKKALIDHELSHCILDDNDNWKIVGHDFDGFNSVVKRHGFWTHRLQRFKKTMTQMSLFEEDKHSEEFYQEHEQEQMELEKEPTPA